ncbi:hypothetical protein Tsubulata_045046, partial [Turnera subulata]
MRAKAAQSKFMRVVTTPVRVLCKARDLYVRGMTNYSTAMVNYSHSSNKSLPAAGGQSLPALPRSMSAVTTRSYNNENEDFMRELLRAASVRSFGHISESDMKQLMMMMQQKQQQPLVGSKSINASSKKLPKSCSVGMRFLGRIDEDKAFDDEEDGEGSDAKPEAKAKQNKFIRVVKTPVRVLCKARDMYVKGMTNYSTVMVNYGHSSKSSSPAGDGQYLAALPRSMSAVPIRCNNNDSEDFRELVRAASVRSLGHLSESDMKQLMVMHLEKQQQPLLGSHESIIASSKKLPKSCSVGMGFLGRIDEDKAFDEEVNEGSDGKPELYPRSRSYAR